MSTRLTLFDHPFFLGFDHIEQEFQRLKKNAGDGYPPYNVEQTGPNGLRITLAVAGFTMNDLDIELENNHLTIRGRQQDDEGRVYLHRGIAARQFQRSFMLADGIEVKGATLDNGLLHVEMARVVPESQARKIAISGPDGNVHDSSPQAIDIDEEPETSGHKETKSVKKRDHGKGAAS